MFFYLLGRCLKSRRWNVVLFDIAKLGTVDTNCFSIIFQSFMSFCDHRVQAISSSLFPGVTVIVTFAICFYPWILSLESTLQVQQIQRTTDAEATSVFRLFTEFSPSNEDCLKTKSQTFGSLFL
eukprot:749094-Hanusia_phi.AAC.2